MKQTFLLLLLCLLFSCMPDQKSLYEFDPAKLADNKISLSEIADDITYIPLDNKFPIGLIYNYKFINNSIYLSAKDIGVMVFDRTGKLQRKIGSIGRGPGEYTYCYLFTVDDIKETVFVGDGGSTIKLYSKNGVFLRSLLLKEYGEGIDALDLNNSNLFVSYPLQFEGVRYDWIILDSLGNLVKKKERTIPPFTSNWLIHGGMYQFESKINHWSPFNDTVFTILPDLNFKTSFLISQGEYRLPRSNIDITKLPFYFNPYSIFETSRFLVIKYLYNKKLMIALIDKAKKKSFLIHLDKNENGGILNDFDGGTEFQPQNYFTENGHEFIVGIINPYQIRARVTSSEFKNANSKYMKKKLEFEKLASSLKETDNPVMMLVRLKK